MFTQFRLPFMIYFHCASSGRKKFILGEPDDMLAARLMKHNHPNIVRATSCEKEASKAYFLTTLQNFSLLSAP
jgi:hypothetical protein